ncbi:pyrroloquinoline quinone biosynthesis protein PqqC [Nostoc sp. ChiQUE01b]|uniref:pyrroloquinoline quinone biosynthesis protein PqqC n=1 Tax=Nostoc sp. ChiQUE01b TaxID=3075376 RepID=UPI002AD29907|nr:pyrroloquinoline quinone biosynthesis protein PqqC [Nostoc sp. ChiQUE01b]MDZ8262454.1 pyrroloquinoline quinone biosynthesis protein PqqC [Nostoc sp. ChiQUE01b]
MSLTQVLLQQPLFKDRVFLKFQDSEVEIRYGNQGCSITIPLEDHEEIVTLFRLLQIGGLSLEQLAQVCPGIQEDIPELLMDFTRRGFLMETQRKVKSHNVNGQQFYRELYRFLEYLKQQFPPSPFSQKMVDGTITKEQLIGYALESYHVTHLCPRLLAPSLANYESRNTQKLLQDFFVSELYHERLIENSLNSVGIKPEQLEKMQPLPMTFAVCSSLGVFASQHSLTFKAALMLFEQDDKAFHELFEQQCQAKELPVEFYKPILLHAGINQEGKHEDITRVLLAEIPYVSPEEQLVVKKNMTILMESMVKRTHEILDYYGNPSNAIPRCFSSLK